MRFNWLVYIFINIFLVTVLRNKCIFDTSLGMN